MLAHFKTISTNHTCRKTFYELLNFEVCRVDQPYLGKLKFLLKTRSDF